MGYQVADWIEARCAIPDREFVGDPFLLTDEQLSFILNFYRLDPVTGQFVYYRGAQLTRPQKWGKGPLSAAIICAEAQGPVLFDGWDPDGEPVGKPWATPLIQVTAVAEDQTENVYSALLPMIELGGLHGEIEDTGLGRINLPGGGKIEPVTSRGLTRRGQRITFAVQDQTESWLQSNGGRSLADNQRRNLGGTGGRWLSTPNAWDPAEESVAQYTSESEHDGVFHDDVDAPDSLSVRNKVERRRALKLVYGDSVSGRRNGRRGVLKPWINLDRIEAEILALLDRDPAQAERFFLNRKQAAEDAAFDRARWGTLVSTDAPAARSLITIGIDGARFGDALAMVATDVELGYQWPLGIWTRPPGALSDYQHSWLDVNGALVDAFDYFEVWRVYVDPQWIEDWVDRWQGEWGAERVVEWRTNRPRPIAWAVRKYQEAVGAGDLSHDGDRLFAEHIGNARKQKLTVRDEKGRQMYTISKDRPDSPRKMDAAMAGVLSWEARGDAIADGATGAAPTVVEVFS